MREREQFEMEQRRRQERQMMDQHHGPTMDNRHGGPPGPFGDRRPGGPPGDRRFLDTDPNMVCIYGSYTMNIRFTYTCIHFIVLLNTTAIRASAFYNLHTINFLD